MEVKFEDYGRFPSWTGCGDGFWLCKIVSLIVRAQQLHVPNGITRDRTIRSIGHDCSLPGNSIRHVKLLSPKNKGYGLTTPKAITTPSPTRKTPTFFKFDLHLLFTLLYFIILNYLKL